MNQSVSILAFYAFVPFSAERLTQLHEELTAFGAERGMRGLTLLATEGINGTVCGTPEAVAAWKERMRTLSADMVFNESEAQGLVFKRWKVDIRREIVNLRRPDATRDEQSHLSPEEWHRMMERDDVAIIDARNTYETKIGMFEGAIDPQTNNFQEFANFAASCEVPKDKPVLMYCTGGIRCEKAVTEMKKHGYREVYQLQGGILNYFKRVGHGKFKGECFVFDHRVAVDGRLQPSRRYVLSPVDGQPMEKLS